MHRVGRLEDERNSSLAKCLHTGALVYKRICKLAVIKKFQLYVW